MGFLVCSAAKHNGGEASFRHVPDFLPNKVAE